MPPPPLLPAAAAAAGAAHNQHNRKAERYVRNTNTTDWATGPNYKMCVQLHHDPARMLFLL
jgi:hypothetical protein